MAHNVNHRKVHCVEAINATMKWHDTTSCFHYHKISTRNENSFASSLLFIGFIISQFLFSEINPQGRKEMSLTSASTYRLLHCETKRGQQFFIVLWIGEHTKQSQKTISAEAIAVTWYSFPAAVVNHNTKHALRSRQYGRKASTIDPIKLKQSRTVFIIHISEWSHATGKNRDVANALCRRDIGNRRT